jgi:predicted nucleic-acid-binding protein
LTGVDTNVLTRYIMQDDRYQSAVATAFLDSRTREDPGFVTLVTMAELCWVLTRRYKLSRKQFSGVMDWLFGSPELQIENGKLAADALLLCEQSNADFPDCLVSLSAKAAGCATVVTFDQQAAKLLAMTLLK